MRKSLNVIVDLASGVAIVSALALVIVGFQTDLIPTEPSQEVVSQDLPAKGDTWLVLNDGS